MGREVTDPLLLAQLNAGGGGGEVTDPMLLQQLNKDTPEERGFLMPLVKPAGADKFELGVPGIVHGPYEAARKLISPQGQYQAGRQDPEGPVLGFEAASLAVGGSGAAVRPAGSLGAGGGVRRPKVGAAEPTGGFEPRFTGEQDKALSVIADTLTAAGVPKEQLSTELAKFTRATQFHGNGTPAPDAMFIADLHPSLQKLLGSQVRTSLEAANVARPALVARQTGVHEPGLEPGAGIPTRTFMDPDAPITGQHGRFLEAQRKAFRLDDKKHHAMGDTAGMTDDMLIARAKEVSDPAYKAFHDAFEKTDLAPTLQPIIKTWQDRAAAAPHTERQTINKALREFAPGGKAVNSSKLFDSAKQYTDEAIAPYFKGGDKGNKYLGGLLVEMKNQLVKAVDDTPKIGRLYARARGVFGSVAEAREALAAGRAAVGDPEEGLKAFAAIPQRENKNLFKLGVHGEKAKVSGKMFGTHDRGKMYASPDQEKLLANIIERSGKGTGKFRDRPQRFGQYVAGEGKMRKTLDTVSGNSATAERAADEITFNTLHTVAEVFKGSRGLSDIGRRGFEFALNKVMGTRSSTSAEIARMLTTANPATRQRVLANLQMRMGRSKFDRFAEIMGEFERQLSQRQSGIGAASAVGMQPEPQ